MEEKHITSNGVTVFFDKNDKLHRFCLCMYLRAGSMYETKDNNGISHFFEHIVFRNIHQSMGKTMYQTLDRTGLEFNAITYKELIQFSITGSPQHFYKATDILSRIFLPIHLPKEEIDLERKRIKAEIREDDEKDSLSYFTKKKVWKGTSLEYSITGNKKNIDQLDEKILKEYQESILTPNRLFFYVTGCIPQNGIHVLSQKISAFTINKVDNDIWDNIAPVAEDMFQRKKHVYVKNSKKTAVCFSVDIDSAKYTQAEMDLMFSMLFEGDCSKIFQELSEKNGYVYSYDPSFEQYKNIAQMKFVYEVQPKNIEKSIQKVVDIFLELKKEIKSELEFVKPGYVDNAYYVLDNAEDYNWMKAYEEHIMGVGYRDMEHRIEAYRKVTAKRMTQICQEIFDLSNIVVTVKGNKSKISKENLLKILQQISVKN